MIYLMPAQWGCVGIQGLPLRGGDGGPTGPYLEGGSSSLKKKKKKNYCDKIETILKEKCHCSSMVIHNKLIQKKCNGQDKMLIDNV